MTNRGSPNRQWPVEHVLNELDAFTNRLGMLSQHRVQTLIDERILQTSRTLESAQECPGPCHVQVVRRRLAIPGRPIVVIEAQVHVASVLMTAMGTQPSAL